MGNRAQNPLSRRIRELRRENGWSMQNLSDLSGVSKSSINMYERGERRPKIEALTSIANAFGVTVDFLCGRTEKRRR